MSGLDAAERVWRIKQARSKVIDAKALLGPVIRDEAQTSTEPWLISGELGELADRLERLAS